jgi:Sigma-70 region 2
LSALTVLQAAHGRGALGAIYMRHHPQVLGLCRYLLGSAEKAEDAAHHIFLRLPRALETYSPEQPLVPWLFRVAREGATACAMGLDLFELRNRAWRFGTCFCRGAVLILRRLTEPGAAAATGGILMRWKPCICFA